jgi:hypothetical protein
MRYPTPNEWLGLVEEFRAGELEQKEFTAKHDVSLGTFRYWLYKKAKGAYTEANSSPKFLPVAVVASTAPKARGTPGELELTLRTGVSLRFEVGTDSRYLAELVAALG